MLRRPYVDEGSGRMGAWLRRYRWPLLVVAVVATGLVVLLLAWPSGRQLPPPRARVYTEFSACLLTDDGGVSGAAAAPVWAGMQAASLKTSGKVSFLAVSGPDTTANAVFYVNTLVQRRCDLVLAVGSTEVAAVRTQASVFPKVHFVVVDSGTATSSSGASSGNLSTVEQSSDAAVSSSVEKLVTQAARGR
jgi:basic membrane lipoprotein Med (substrate-binding protein (PBP1-ABC) superfamily)